MATLRRSQNPHPFSLKLKFGKASLNCESLGSPWNAYRDSSVISLSTNGGRDGCYRSVVRDCGFLPTFGDGTANGREVSDGQFKRPLIKNRLGLPLYCPLHVIWHIMP